MSQPVSTASSVFRLQLAVSCACALCHQLPPATASYRQSPEFLWDYVYVFATDCKESTSFVAEDSNTNCVTCGPWCFAYISSDFGRPVGGRICFDEGVESEGPKYHV